MGDAFDEVYGTEPKDAFDEVYGTAPAAAPKDAFDEVYAAPAAPGEDIGRLAGSILARAPRDAFDNPAARDWYKGHADEAGVQQGTPSFWTPEDTDNAITYGVPAAALATGMALPAMGAWGTLATGLGTGAVARGVTAKLRGQDVTEAVTDPTSIGIDAALSGVPLMAQGTKYVWRNLPETVTAPVGSAARYVGGKAADATMGAVSKAANWIAKRKPGYGETLLEDRPVTMDDIFGGQRPDLRPDLATEPIEGLANRHGRTITDQVTEKLSGNVRLLRGLGRDDLADQIELANNIERRLSNHFGPIVLSLIHI